MICSKVWQGLALVGMVLATGCSDDDDIYEDVCNDQRVDSTINPLADLSTYHTFAVPAPDTLPPDLPLNVQAGIQASNAAATKELMAKGLVPVEPDAMPDLTVFSLVRSSEESGVIWTCVPGYYWGWWGYTWSSCAWVEAVPVQYTVGTLLTGVADPAKQMIPFAGSAKGILDCASSTQQSIETAVSFIYSKYPALP